MPNRILRDAALDSDRLAAVSEPAEVLFYRLLMLADDFGRFDGRPSVIRARAYALRQSSVSEDDVIHRMTELCKVGLIHSYIVSGKPYISIPRFGQRQRADKSKFPEMPVICQSNDGQMTDVGQHSAARARAVVVVDVVEGDDKAVVDLSPLPPFPRGTVDKSKTAKPSNATSRFGLAAGAHCAYCDRPHTATANGRKACDEHFQLALDNERPSLLLPPPHARDQDPANRPQLDPDQGYVLKPKRGKFDDEPEPPPST